MTTKNRVISQLDEKTNLVRKCFGAFEGFGWFIKTWLTLKTKG